MNCSNYCFINDFNDEINKENLIIHFSFNDILQIHYCVVIIIIPADGTVVFVVAVAHVHQT